MTSTLVYAGELMAQRSGSVDPSRFPDEEFELHSIPAFDAGMPEILKGDQIGSTKKLVEPNDVMISKIVPHIRRSSIVPEFTGRRQIASSEWIVFRSAQFFPDYLRHVLTSNDFHAKFMATVSGVGGSLLRARPAEVAKIKIPLPPLAEQRRLAGLLSHAEGIVRLRREAQAKAAELIPALFLDMFGDPASNPKGWPVVELGEYLAIPSSVKTPDLEVEADLPCIGADSIESGTGKIVSWPTVGDIRPISGKYFFEKDDVLYSKIRPALRKAILAPSNGYCSADMYPLRPTHDRATPEFVAALLLSKDFTDYAIGVSMRAQMPKVNRETLFAYKAPLPPIDLQYQFAAKVEAVRAIATQQTAGLTTAQATFDALLHQAFQR